jgi:uncharacterized OsmC-like protein/pimeloyl-ACP methyl ester carboxylesterase
MTAPLAFDFMGGGGQTLSGRLDLPTGEPQAYAVFAHCFACSKTAIAAVHVSRALTALGFGVLRFDFTGLGASEGDFADSGFTGEVSDLVAAVGAMTAAGRSPALLVGHSLGGAAVLAAAGGLPQIKAVATLGAPFDIGHVTHLFEGALPEIEAQGQAQVTLAGARLTLTRAFLEDLRHQDQGSRIAALHRPLLVMHSPIDEIVGVDSASAIFLAARHPKSFVCLDGANHLLTRPGDAEYAAQVIAAWATKYLPALAVPTPAATDGRVLVEDTGVGAYQVRVSAGGAPILADEPPEVGGKGTGPTPYGLVSAGLGACTAMTLRLYAAQKMWALSHVKVLVGHSKDPKRSPPDLFTREITLEGDLTDEQRARLMQIADKCPVHRTLEQGSKVETTEAGHVPPPPPAEPVAQHLADMKAACAE